MVVTVNWLRRRSVSAGAIIIGIACIGTWALNASHATTPTTALEAESGTILTPALIVSDTTASANHGLKFMTASTSGGGSTAKPDATNTGYQHTGTALTVVNGNQTYATNNQVVSGLDIHGTVKITGTNVTLKNSIIRGDSAIASDCTASVTHNSAVLWITGSATVEDTEVAPSVVTSCLDGVWAQSTTLLRDNIHGSVDGIKSYDNTTIQDSYVHDLTHYDSQPAGGGETHNDAVQSYQANQHLNFIHNNFDLDNNENSVFQLTQDGGTPAKDIHLDGNWIYGGGCSLNFSSKGAANITAANNITVTNNRFGPDAYGNCNILLGTTVALTTQSGNVLDATGKPITVQQHD